jgi:hypothetical protein
LLSKSRNFPPSMDSQDSLLSTRACNTILFWARWIQSTSSLRSILTLPYHPHLGLPNDIFALRFQPNTLYAFLISLIHATCPTHLTLHDFITLKVFDEEYKLWSSSLYNFLHPPITFLLLKSNILNILRMTDQVSHQYKNTCKILIF